MEHFVKIPVLFEHYQEHKVLNSEISIFHFLSMHYLGNDIDDNDHDRDMELPFKKGDIQITTLVFIPTPIVNIQFSIFNNHIEKCILFQDSLYPNSDLNALFRPPCA